MEEEYSLKKCFCVKDIDAFIGVFGDVFSKIAIIVTMLLFVEKMPKEIVLGRILPGVGIGSICGCIVYFIEAQRLAIKENRSDVTGLPFGISSTQTLTWLFIIIIPIYRQTGDALHAWQVGLASCFFGGFIEISGGFLYKLIRKYIPISALLGNMVAGSLIWLSFTGIAKVFDQPGIALVPLFLILLSTLYKKNFIQGIPNSILIILIGVATAWFTGDLTVQHIRETVQDVSFYAPSLYLKDIFIGLKDIKPYLSLIIPLQIANFLSTMQGVESARMAGDNYNLKSTMIFDGITTVISSIFGSPFPTTVYYGHPGWKRIGARSGHTLYMIIPYICLFFGLPLFINALIPASVIMVFIVNVGIVVGVEVQNEFKKDYSSIIYLSLLPIIAQLVMNYINDAFSVMGTSVFTMGLDKLVESGFLIQGIYYLSNGAFTSSLMFSIWIAYILKENYKAASVTSFLLAVFSAIGLVHQAEVTLFGKGSIPFIISYSLIGITTLLLGFKERKQKKINTPVTNSK